MNSQNQEKSRALTGADNKRMNKTSQSDSQVTAAWAQTGQNAFISNPNLNPNPDSQAVRNAKEWVDNGSRL